MSTLFDLSGKTAIVTGSSRGIGKAIAHRLAEHGANVVVSSRKLDACEAAVKEINERRRAAKRRSRSPPTSPRRKRCRIWWIRPAKRSARSTFWSATPRRNPYFGPMGGITDEQFTKILQNNIVSNHWLINMVAPEMAQSANPARSSSFPRSAACAAPPCSAPTTSPRPPTCSSRAISPTEFGPDNVRINTIAPGLVKTDFARALWDNPAILATYTERSCLKRIGSPTKSPAWRFFWPRRPAPSRPARLSCSMAAKPSSE